MKVRKKAMNNRMRFALTALAAAVAMVAVLAGCATKSNGASSSTNTSTTTQNGSAESSTPEASAGAEITGTVKEISKEAITITREDGTELSAVLDEATEFTREAGEGAMGGAADDLAEDSMAGGEQDGTAATGGARIAADGARTDDNGGASTIASGAGDVGMGGPDGTGMTGVAGADNEGTDTMPQDETLTWEGIMLGDTVRLTLDDAGKVERLVLVPGVGTLEIAAESAESESGASGNSTTNATN